MFNGIIEGLRNGNIEVITGGTVNDINRISLEFLEQNKYDIQIIEDIIWISNVLYNNTDRTILPLDDGIYDLVLVKYESICGKYKVGAEPIIFTESDNSIVDNMVVDAFRELSVDCKDMMFYNNLKPHRFDPRDYMEQIFIYKGEEHISKRLVTSKQSFPELVGTLDKCKFVLNSEAISKGVFEDSNVKILERDFFGKHIEMGILDPKRKVKIILELKYDGVSIVGEVDSEIKRAFTRGDTGEGMAADLSSIFYGYQFPRSVHMDNTFGMKFEAIMTYTNLYKYNALKNKNYSNCRTAISGLLSSSDAHKYKHLITLVPLATSLGLDRTTDMVFMNEYYSSGEELKYAVIEGDYVAILYQIRRFLEDAEMMRDRLDFMYDGIVVTYAEEDIMNILGRVNSVNKYSMAVKFNASKKSTTFLGYTFTIGQDGSITPMIHYEPVEFFGTIHTKSTGHSYSRYMDLGLRHGDIIDVEYVNDVMPYVTKQDNHHNRNNHNALASFISECPSCGNNLKISKSNKTILCDNISCPERNLKRITSLVHKLNIKDFSEARIKDIGKYTFRGLLECTFDDVGHIGNVAGMSFLENMNTLKSTELYDYKIMGALGFTGMGEEKWKLILNNFTLEDIININENVKNGIMNVRGLGGSTITIIENELPFFIEDMIYINNMNNVIRTLGMKSSGPSIRFTGFRDKKLMELLNTMGYDASDKGVTKSTDILLIPHVGFTSSKLSKVGPNTQIIAVSDFCNSLNINP